MGKSFEQFKEEVANRVQELKSVDIDMGFNDLGCVELAEQKAHLMRLMIGNNEAGGDSILEGLLCVLDTIQDQLQDYHGFDEDVVFPYKNHPPADPDPISYRAALGSLLKAMPIEDLPKYLNESDSLSRVLTNVLAGREI